MTLHGDYYLPKMKPPHNSLTPPPDTDLEEGYRNDRNVSRKVEALEKNLARLSESIHEAINKCRPFLVSDPRDTDSAGCGPVPTPPMSPHAHTLDCLNDKVWDLGTLVKEFTSSVDS